MANGSFSVTDWIPDFGAKGVTGGDNANSLTNVGILARRITPDAASPVVLGGSATPRGITHKASSDLSVNTVNPQGVSGASDVAKRGANNSKQHQGVDAANVKPQGLATSNSADSWVVDNADGVPRRARGFTGLVKQIIGANKAADEEEARSGGVKRERSNATQLQQQEQHFAGLQVRGYIPPLKFTLALCCALALCCPTTPAELAQVQNLQRLICASACHVRHVMSKTTQADIQ